MLTAARFFFLSACLWLAALALAGPVDLRAKVESADSESKYSALVPELNQTLGGDWSIKQSKDPAGLETLEPNWATRQAEALQQLDNLVALEQAAKGKVGDARAEAAQIVSRPEFHDTGVSSNKNWLSLTMERAGKAISEWLSDLWKKMFGDGREASMPSSGFGAMNFQPLVWGVLIAGLLGFAYYAITKFRWTFSRRVKAGGLLAEDEPDRTADEWISRSEELSANKQYREAVRCLYLACLVRFDEANVMRFRRGETNWEHLYRFDDSPRRPTNIDLKWATKAFDTIWYGHRTQGQPDVDKFRDFYNQVVEATRRVKAAA